MSLNDICNDILTVMDGLECGTINFTYDKLASAMKIGHPADILGSVIAEIVFDVRDGIVPKTEAVDNVLKGLKRFKRNFKVKELSKPITDLTNYLKERNSNT